MLNFGGFLSSNFWTNYRCQSSASIEDLLNNKECSVDKLLDDDDCLQEFKNFNDKLIKYFDHDKLKVLIDYITVMPTKEDGHSRGHKYPFIAGEIFNCEINQILDKFFEAPVKVKAVAAEEEADADKEDSDRDPSKQESSGASEETPAADASEDKPQEEAKAGAAEGAAVDLAAEESKKEDDEETKDETEKNPQEQKAEETKEEEVKVEVKTEEKAEEEPEESKDSSDKTEDSSDSKAEAEETEAANTDEQKNSQEPESEEQEKAQSTEKEPEEEDPDKKDTLNEDAALEPAASTQATQVTEADEEDETTDNKYVLLDRLFKFIAEPATEEELNPVLSGYFCKLVSLLISRKQKQLVPYIFRQESVIIDQLVEHVGQKSISEILNKLLTQIETDFEPEVLTQIQQKQQLIVSKLISKLGPSQSEESNLNGSSIIQDMFEVKEFYNIICKKESVEAIADYATAPMNENTKSSKVSSLLVLNQIISHNIEKQKKKDANKTEAKTAGEDEDDDIIVQQNSDDEANDDQESTSTIAQANVLVEVLQVKIPEIAVILQNDHDGPKVANSLNHEQQAIPLGQQRLRTVELVLKMVQMRKEAIYEGLGRSKVFSNIVALVKQYPWNNYLQLKAVALFNEVIDNCENNEFRKQFFESSGIGKALVEMGDNAQYVMGSTRKIRNGYMNLVVTIANKLQKKYTENGAGSANEDQTLYQYLDSVGEEWRVFVDKELAQSNENN